MNVKIRNNHKQKFENWIRESKVRDADELHMQALGTIENMATDLTEGEVGSTLGSTAMLWYIKNKMM